MTVMDVNEIYASISKGCIDRLRLRGRTADDAIADTSFLLSFAMMLNLLAVAVLLGLRLPRSYWPYLGGLFLFWTLERLNKKLIRELVGLGLRRPEHAKRDSIASMAYILGSIALFLIVSFATFYPH